MWFQLTTGWDLLLISDSVAGLFFILFFFFWQSFRKKPENRVKTSFSSSSARQRSVLNHDLIWPQRTEAMDLPRLGSSLTSYKTGAEDVLHLKIWYLHVFIEMSKNYKTYVVYFDFNRLLNQDQCINWGLLWKSCASDTKGHWQRLKDSTHTFSIWHDLIKI